VQYRRFREGGAVDVFGLKISYCKALRFKKYDLEMVTDRSFPTARKTGRTHDALAARRHRKLGKIAQNWKERLKKAAPTESGTRKEKNYFELSRFYHKGEEFGSASP
jgi:hypothetical protein